MALDKANNEESYKALHLVNFTGKFPKNLKALIRMYMKAHNIIELREDSERGTFTYVERCPKQMFVSMWLNDMDSTEHFKKVMQYNVEDTTENVDSFLERVEEWYNHGRFRSG